MHAWLSESLSRWQSFKFNDVPRFVNDGTTRPDRIPNCKDVACLLLMATCTQITLHLHLHMQVDVYHDDQ
jgi:hypothetical protein